MNSGIVASRYAEALLRFVQETGNGDKVYSQAGSLVKAMEGIARLRDYILIHDDISLETKRELVEAAVGEPMAMELDRFISLVSSRRRFGYLLRMLQSFLSRYREANNIRIGRLVTPVPVEGLRERLEAIFRERTGSEVHLSEESDPEMLGGFVFELDDWRMDASVEGRLKAVRRNLIEKNNRIV